MIVGGNGSGGAFLQLLFQLLLMESQKIGLRKANLLSTLLYNLVLDVLCRMFQLDMCLGECFNEVWKGVIEEVCLLGMILWKFFT